MDDRHCAAPAPSDLDVRVASRRRHAGTALSDAQLLDQMVARQRPPSRAELDAQAESRRNSRQLAASAAAKAGGAASLVAVLLGAQVLASGVEATSQVLVKTSSHSVITLRTDA